MTRLITDKAAHDKLVNARINLLLDHFFFGRLAMHLVFVEEKAIPTLAVDGKHIFYNPAFVHTLNSDLTKSAVCHEILHPSKLDHLRRGNRDPKLWNYAADYVINLILKDCGFAIGKGWLLDEKYRDMTTEEIYAKLMEEGGGKGGGAGMPGTGEPGGPLDDIMDGAASAGDAAEQQLEWEVAVQQAAKTAREHGKLPGALDRFLKSMEQPQVDWREKLQRFITDKCKSDYSWMRASRKMIPHGLYLPSLYSEQMGTLVEVIDDSGSINDTVLAGFGAEVTAAWQAARPQKMVTIYCDAKVQRVYETMHGEELPEFAVHGGGGTDFRPPFAWVDENAEVQPACLVYLTDGYGPFPDHAPSYPVLWVMTTDVVPPWGEYVRIRL